MMNMPLEPALANAPEVRRAMAVACFRRGMDLLRESGEERRACRFCGNDFVVPVEQVAWYLLRFLNTEAVPRRCEQCRRAARRESR
jgi:hypothetical protein